MGELVDMLRYKIRRMMRDWTAEGMREGFIASGMTPEEADAHIAEAEEMFVRGEVEEIQERLNRSLRSNTWLTQMTKK